MAGEKTTYYRIYTMLELSAKFKPTNSDEFKINIINDHPRCFVYERWKEGKVEKEPICSIKSIEKTFKWAVDLELLDQSSGKLTSNGLMVTTIEKYNDILNEVIGNYLDKINFPLKSIEEQINIMLKSNTIIIPTADEIYNHLCGNNLEVSISTKDFRVIMRLLAKCGGIRSSRCQIYLP